jgi:tetratricopeptide (TPR) repeat protein
VAPGADGNDSAGRPSEQTKQLGRGAKAPQHSDLALYLLELALSPGGAPLTAFERPDTAVLVRQRLLENAEDVDALFVLAALRVQAGDVEEGLSILDHVLRIDPRYPGAWRFKAKLHRMNGDSSAERSARERAQDVEP